MNIIAKPTVSKEQIVLWAKDKKANDLAMELIPTFWDIAIKHNLNPVVVYCQAMKETGFMKFGGVLDTSFHNPCGLKIAMGGGCDDPQAHQRFDSWTDGITAQCEHLSLYAGVIIENPIDPRHFDYLLGKCKTVEELSGNWAGAGYGEAIIGMCSDIEMY